MRDRLIELLSYIKCKAECCSALDGGRCGDLDKLDRCQIDAIADHLLANGVIVPPYRNETTIYFVESAISCIWEGRIASWSVQKDGLWFYAQYTCGLNYWHEEQDIGKTVFLSREEAEKALKKRSDTE